jgi:hypothetical protein
VEEMCDDETMDPVRPDEEELTRVYGFVEKYLKVLANKEKGAALAETIAKLTAWRDKVDTGNVEATHELTDELRQIIGEAEAIVADGGLGTMNSGELEALQGKVDGTAKALNIS